MANALFFMEAYVQEGSGTEREIVLSKPGAAAWRAGLPVRLDQPPTTAALVEYVVKLYFRQMPVEAELTGCATLAASEQHWRRLMGSQQRNGNAGR